MPRGRDDENVRQDLRFAINLAIVGAVEVNEVRQRVIRCRASLLELAGLNEDRAAGERRVAAAMIEMEMTVCHPADVVDGNPGATHRVRQWSPDGPVMRIDLGVPFPQAGIEEQPAGWMLDCIAKHTLDAGLASPGLFGGPHEITQINPPDRR